MKKMKKKPKIIIAIAVWIFLQQTIFVRYPLWWFEQYSLLPIQAIKSIRGILAGVVLIVVIKLAQFKRIPKVISSLFLGLSSGIIIMTAGSMILTGQISSTKSLITYGVMLIVNLLCGWYLWSASFQRASKHYQQLVKTEDDNKEAIANTEQ